MVEITCVVDAGAELGEGTLWDPQAGVLWWIDIWKKLIHRYEPSTGKDEVFETPEYLGCLGLPAGTQFVHEHDIVWIAHRNRNAAHLAECELDRKFVAHLRLARTRRRGNGRRIGDRQADSH